MCARTPTPTPPQPQEDLGMHANDLPRRGSVGWRRNSNRKFFFFSCSFPYSSSSRPTDRFWLKRFGNALQALSTVSVVNFDPKQIFLEGVRDPLLARLSPADLAPLSGQRRQPAPQWFHDPDLRRLARRPRRCSGLRRPRPVRSSSPSSSELCLTNMLACFAYRQVKVQGDISGMRLHFQSTQDDLAPLQQSMCAFSTCLRFSRIDDGY